MLGVLSTPLFLSRGGSSNLDGQDVGMEAGGTLLSTKVGVGGTLVSNVLDLSKKMYLMNSTVARVMVISCK